MKNILFVLCTIFVLSSCEKVLFKPNMGSKDPLKNFDYLWEEVDKKYSYFELKNIDWNQVKETYRSQLNSNSSEEELFNVLASMLNELRDDHTNLISPFNISQYNIMLTSPANYYQRTIDEYYLPQPWITGPFNNGFLDNKQIGYIRYGSFLSSFTDEQLDLILNRFKDTKGLILDLRANGGGNIFNVPKLLGRFTDSTILAGYTITRNGPDHNSFSDREDFKITPYDGVRYSKKIIVLIDRGSYSATTFFSLLTKAFPNITLMGDTTGGGGGLPNGGQLPNGWTYRFSISQLLDLNGNNYAEDGVAPEIFESFNWSDLTKDEILDRAILELQ
ncbi:MAG: S41 family peptidase [Bacteroidota bacterium]|jgi:C-terminal processing protease CtpA/Prc